MLQAAQATPSVPFDALPHVLLALATVVVAARLLGIVFAKLRQPPVMGEVVAGILLGPSLLGRIAPTTAEFLLPPPVAPFLGVLAQLGVVLYMFLVGLELDLAQVRRRSRATFTIAQASIVVPFAVGCALALPLHPRFAAADVPLLHFALFCGIAMSITAFPVLARILTDRRAQASDLGLVALACAAINDVTAWCLLALVVGLVHSDASSGARTTLLAAGFVAVMLTVVRPALARYIRAREQAGRADKTTLATLLVLLLVAALASEAIGVHALFGAFLLGALIPADSAIARDLLDRLEDFVVVLFLPAFFAYTGMRTQIGLLGTGNEWSWCLAIVAVACLGKFGGTFAAARAHGFQPRSAAVLGALMNTRGLMELIVLNVGLDLGILSPTLFTMFVVMALATTPVIDALGRGRDLWALAGPGSGR